MTVLCANFPIGDHNPNAGRITDTNVGGLSRYYTPDGHARMPTHAHIRSPRNMGILQLHKYNSYP